MDDKSILQVDAFVRSINVNQTSPHAIFLGAGASLSSCIPSAGQCVEEWKREIFVANNPTMKDSVSEQSILSVQKRIDGWLQANGCWPEEGVDDYSFFIEQCHPIPDDRRRYFEQWILTARPYIGYQLLCILAQANIIRSVWTTNFDTLVVKAAAMASIVPIEIGIDSKDRVNRQESSTELLCVSMHGDYRYDDLKNTGDELKAQERQLKRKLVDTLGEQSLIVMGYSGRDASVMAALEEALCKPGNTKIYWCGFSDTPSDEVRDLIAMARKHNRYAFYVPNSDFDDLMVRLATVCLPKGDLQQSAITIIGSKIVSDLPEKVAFGKVNEKPTGLIKSNAWPIDCPSEVLTFELTKWPEKAAWKWLESLVANIPVVAVPFRNKVIAFGTIDDIKEVFDGQIKGPIDRVPINQSDLTIADGAVVSLLKRAVIVAISDKLSLDTDKKYKLWEKSPNETRKQGVRSFKIHRCMVIDIRFIDQRMYLTVDPTFYIPTNSADEERDSIEIRKRLIGWQHNNKYNAELDHWRIKLSIDNDTTVFDYPPKSGSFKFRLSNSPAFASITRPGHREYPIPDRFLSLVHHKGIVLKDSNLLFGRKGSSDHARDQMPLRGIQTFAPFDNALSILGNEHPVRISVVCPKAESMDLEQFLAGIERPWQPENPEKEDYLVPYRGFEQEFRVPIRMPSRSDRTWFELPELTELNNEETASRELANNINTAISSSASIERSIVLILTPKRWEKYRRFDNANERFDVHDNVKAYSAQRGIATQFLTQEKLGVQDKCRFWWWFSVALYAKAMRTPWVLQGLDENTAYIGLGYAFDRNAKRGEQIVLGCSHLYNSQGQGLDFRLAKIDKSIIRNRNAFMSYDDARRMGNTIRSLYWDYKRKLPERVVIHKLSPFDSDEQKGLLAGLGGVKNLELLEINSEPNLRYVNSVVKNGKLEVYGYPVRRGTVIRLSNYEALLWVHGATDAVQNSNFTYFQGKRRIPGPVIIRRHAGSSQLSTIVNEVLGLSKMDWNSGDLYSQHPATVVSSKRIAKIGSLLDQFGSESFDYRLFM